MNLNFKKIISLLIVVVLCGSVGFAPNVVFETSSDTTVVGSTPNTNEKLLYKVTKKPKGGYKATSYSENELIGQTNTNTYYSDVSKAKLAVYLGVVDQTKFESKIAEVQNNPTDYKESFAVISKSGYSPSVTGYQSIASENSGHNQQILTWTQELEKSTTTEERKRELNGLIVEEQKKIELNREFMNEYPPTLEEQGALLANLNDEERLAVMDAINKKECGSGLNSYIPFCEFFVGSSADQAIRASFIANIKDNFENKEDYNTALYTQFSDLYNNVDCNSQQTCQEKIEFYENNKGSLQPCAGDETCISERDEKLEEMKKMLDLANQKSQVETNWLYSVFDAINNQDQQARASAKFFGFGADYDDLPNWLAEQGVAASQICLGEIDGYLDEDSTTGGSTVKSDGDMTKYGYGIELNENGNPINQASIDIAYDIRAKRTKTTPDGKTALTVSIYLKAPTNDNISYMLGLSYKTGDRFVNKLLINKTTLPAGDSIGDIIPWDIEVKNPSQVNEDSFEIHLKARKGSGTVVAEDKTTVYLVSTGEDNLVTVDGTEVSGNNEGNTQDSTNDDVEQDTDTFWDGFDG